VPGGIYPRIKLNGLGVKITQRAVHVDLSHGGGLTAADRRDDPRV
jgi:hypothetical protein